jgi:hypothetical protein
MQMKIDQYGDAIVEWVPYNQFNDIKEISKDDFATFYSAIWIKCKVILMCSNNSQNITIEFLNKV